MGVKRFSKSGPPSEWRTGPLYFVDDKPFADLHPSQERNAPVVEGLCNGARIHLGLGRLHLTAESRRYQPFHDFFLSAQQSQAYTHVP